MLSRSLDQPGTAELTKSLTFNRTLRIYTLPVFEALQVRKLTKFNAHKFQFYNTERQKSKMLKMFKANFFKFKARKRAMRDSRPRISSTPHSFRASSIESDQRSVANRSWRCSLPERVWMFPFFWIKRNGAEQNGTKILP